MDILSVVGVLLGFGSIIGGNILEGGHMSSLIQGTAFLIVAGGTAAAVMVQTPPFIMKRAMQMLPWCFLPPVLDSHEAIQKILEWSSIARKEGLLGLEPLSENEQDPFARKGLQLLVDGGEPETIRNILELEISTREHMDQQAAKVYENAGGFSPTIGIIGAVMGLIHVMGNLSDPSKLGAGIAVAFVATIYGVGMANLLLIPMGGKLKQLTHSQTQHREMMMEGIVSIAEGENPRNIEIKLQGYLH